MAKLTKRTVDSATAGDKVAMIWDDQLRGFGLRVYPNGRKVYIVKCRIKGRQRFITVGRHGPVTADQARTEAYNILSEAKNGRDPAREHDRIRKSPTMKELGKRFLTDHVALRCKASTEVEYRRSVELFINPKLGTRKVTTSSVEMSANCIIPLVTSLIRQTAPSACSPKCSIWRRPRAYGRTAAIPACT